MRTGAPTTHGCVIPSPSLRQISSFESLKIRSNVITLADLLKGVLDSAHLTTGESLSDITASNLWFLGEIVERPLLVPEKLYQLERALHFLPRSMDIINEISCVAVLMNGEKHEFEAVCERYLNPLPSTSTLLLSKHRVLFGWTPYRSVYTEIARVNSNWFSTTCCQ